jgi:hypothetical protein
VYEKNSIGGREHTFYAQQIINGCGNFVIVKKKNVLVELE